MELVHSITSEVTLPMVNMVANLLETSGLVNAQSMVHTHMHDVSIFWWFFPFKYIPWFFGGFTIIMDGMLFPLIVITLPL